MLTHVKDHLTGCEIPVRYVEPGMETEQDLMDALRSLALSSEAISAEQYGMNTSQLDVVNDHGRELLGNELFQSTAGLIWDHDDDAYDRSIDVTEALVETALAVTALPCEGAI